MQRFTKMFFIEHLYLNMQNRLREILLPLSPTEI